MLTIIALIGCAILELSGVFYAIHTLRNTTQDTLPRLMTWLLLVWTEANLAYVLASLLELGVQ